MGSSFEFKCDKCGYSACVSGGPDRGMVAYVETMVCLDCKELVDVLVAIEGRDGPVRDPSREEDFDRCPQCGGKSVTSWPKGRPCPKCGGPVARGEEVLHWD